MSILMSILIDVLALKQKLYTCRNLCFTVEIDLIYKVVLYSFISCDFSCVLILYKCDVNLYTIMNKLLGN